MKKQRYVIGIDGGTKTGVAVWDIPQNKLVDLFTSSFWNAYDTIIERFDPAETLIVVEWLNAGALYARTFNASRAGRDKFAANVGSVRRETALLAEGFERAFFTVERRTIPNRAPKWTPEHLTRVIGYEERSSAHARDALRVIFLGRPVINPKKR